MESEKSSISHSKSTDYYLTGIRENNREVLAEIYQDFLPGLTKYILNNKGTAENARDIFQEALLILFTKSTRPDFELKGTFKNYLHGICKNLWLRHLKKKQVSGVTFDEISELSDEYDLEKEMAQQDKETLFFKYFTQLDPTCQAVLKAFFEGMPLKKIAQKMGYTEKYIKQKNYKCKHHLASLIESDPRYEELIE